jgi:hypothetical protein
MVVCPRLPEAQASESEHGGGSTGVPEWQLQDWDGYDFPEGAGTAGGGGHGGCGSDPFATRFDGLPGFIAEDIAVLLSIFPLLAAGAIPGMTVDDATQVFHVIQHTMMYTMLCIMLCNIHDTQHVICHVALKDTF